MARSFGARHSFRRPIIHIERIAGENFGILPSFDHELVCGSIGICGPNGVGKSTLLNAMYALITNDFSRAHAKKSDCVRDTSGEGAPAWLEGTIVHNSRRIVVRRALAPKSTSTVWIDGGKPITDTNKSQAEIYKILGIDRPLIDLFVFKQQFEIYDFLSVTPAARAKAFSVLCRTEKCEKLWDALGDFMTKDTEAQLALTDDTDDGRQAEAVAQGEVTRIEAAIEEQQEIQLSEQSQASANKLLAMFEQKMERQEALDAAKEKLATARARKASVTASVQAAEDALKAGVDALAACKMIPVEDYQEAKTGLALLAAFKKQKAEKTRLKAEAGALAEEEEEHTKPVKPVDYEEDTEALSKRRADVTVKLEAARDFLGTFKETGVAVCPTCKTPTKNLTKVIAETEASIGPLEMELEQLAGTLEAFRKYRKQARDYAEWRSDWEARKRANIKALASLGDKAATEVDEEAARKTITRYEAAAEKRSELEETIDEARTAVSSARESLATITGRITAQKEACAAWETSLAEVDVADEDVERAKKRLAEHAQASEAIASLNGELKAAKAALVAAKEFTAKQAVKMKRTKRVRDMLKVLATARDTLHRDNLPRRVAQANLARIRDNINNGLERFGRPFWVEMSEDLGFIVHKQDSPPQPADWLSTGQRVVLAMAFWPAVASLWGADLGMLALDEPSANLDAVNRRFLGEAISELTARVRGNKQFIAVTHDSDLRSSFDQVIELGVSA
jgi:DNA repair exonuclease SbcCD ATPase subunit